MKRLLFLLLLLCATKTFALKYFPFVIENASWQVLYTTYPVEFQLSVSTSHLHYYINGEENINDKIYHKLYMKTILNGEEKISYSGAIREENKKVFYVGNGFYTSPINIPRDKIQAVKQCIASSKNFDGEMLLYDFNAKPGDVVQWGFMYNQVISEDSILIGNAFRRRLHLSNNEDVIEGIGFVKSWLLYGVTPMLLCSPNVEKWKFENFSESGRVLFQVEDKIKTPDYQTVYSNRKAYFLTEFGSIETLRIDSADWQGGDTILYPMRTMQLVGNDCYAADGGGFAGKKVIVGKSWNYFFNQDNDTIKIKTDAVLKESWTMFQRNDITVSATVTAWDTMSVLGVVDSVKTLTLHVFDLTMKPLPHQLEGYKLIISKNFGWIQMLNFTYFPLSHITSISPISQKLTLAGILNPKMGVENLTWFDAHDFQVGDEFHYISSNNYFMDGGTAESKKTIIRIINRENLDNKIVYFRDVETLIQYQQSQKDSIQIIYKHYQDTSFIGQNPEFDIEPGVPIWNNDSSMVTIHVDFGFNRLVVPEIYSKNTNCWSKAQVCRDVCSIILYKKGRGIVTDMSCGPWNNDTFEQVYYKKGDKSWGVPLVLTGKQNPDDQSFIKVFPNPVDEFLSISLPSPPKFCYFILYDAGGSLVRKFQLNETDNQLNLGDLSKGIYWYRIMMDGVIIKNGKMLKFSQTFK